MIERRRVAPKMSSYSSPVQLSQFDPQGLKICYVTVELDKQRITVIDTNGQNEQSMLLDKSSLRVKCIKWAQIGDANYILLGLNEGEIWIYALSANRIMAKMSTGDCFEIKDITIANDNVCWAVDGQDFFYKFDMTEFNLKEKFRVENCEEINRLCFFNEENLLVASCSVSLVHLPSKTVSKTFPGHITPVIHLQLISRDFFITGALNDRFLNVYDIETTISKSVLVLESNLSQISVQNDSCVAATTEEGEVEVFEDPLVPIKGNKRRTKRSRQCNKRIYMNKNGGFFRNIHLRGEVLQLVWFENVTMPKFASLDWRQLPADFEFEIKYPQHPSRTRNNNELHPLEPAAAVPYKEGNATTISGDNFRYVSDAIRDWENEMMQLERFNEQTRTESLADRLGQTIITKGKRKPWASPGTVTVLLSQALQANDNSLLENALNNRDERIIRDTLIRLRPPLAVLLLERLADRIARQSHRQQQLNVWVKWTLVIHGGYLVTIPDLISSLSSLHSTLKKRSDLLPRLIVLETRIESTLNSLHQQDDDLEPLIDSEVDERDVEYNEEREDALMEDGEAIEELEEDATEYESNREEVPDDIPGEYIQVE